MMKWYADAFKFKEGSMTRRSLNRVRFFVFLSIPLYPIFLLDSWNLVSGLWLSIVLPISGIGLLGFAFTPISNRLFGRDRYLDEWEISLKHESMAFAFQFMIWFMFPVMFGLMFLSEITEISLRITEFYQLGFLMTGLIIVTAYVQILYAVFKIRPINSFEDETVLTT